MRSSQCPVQQPTTCPTTRLPALPRLPGVACVQREAFGLHIGQRNLCAKVEKTYGDMVWAPSPRDARLAPRAPLPTTKSQPAAQDDRRRHRHHHHSSLPSSPLPQCRGYLHYLIDCPSFVHNVCHEDLGGSERLRAPCPDHLKCYYCLRINPLYCMTIPEQFGGPDGAPKISGR